MLYLMLHLADTPQKDEREVAYANAWQMAHRLKGNPQEIPGLVQAMNYLCAQMPHAENPNWNNSLRNMPESFFGNNFHCLYRLLIPGGVLMVVLCTVSVPMHNAKGDVYFLNRSFPRILYATSNGFTGMYEVRALPQYSQSEFLGVSDSGNQILALMRMNSATPVSVPSVSHVIAQSQEPEKKSWWKKMTGK